jgi:hypothetical protein
MVDRAGTRVPVSWKVRAGGSVGKFPVEASSGTTKTKPLAVEVKGGGIFG